MDALTAMKQALEALSILKPDSLEDKQLQGAAWDALKAAIEKNEKDSLELELWKDGALLHEAHYEYQNKLKDMITELLFSGKNVIHKDCEFKALALIKK